jgi:signal transduction histidine kinase
VPWHSAEQHLARELRRYATELDLVKQVKLHQAAVRARDDLVAVVSHDLRTPVSVIAMQATLLQRFLGEGSIEGSKRLMTSAQTIQRAADRMTSLLRDLLDLAKIEAGRFSVDIQPHEAGLLVHDACELTRQLAESRGIQLIADESSQCLVQADAERVFQVFSNLISNSIKFTREGGVIKVGAHQDEAQCAFWVNDTGPGMSAEQLAHVFDRFWQGKSLDESGAGLGLYICKGIVEAHGGRIWAESELGRGTTVRFTLPCLPPGKAPDFPLSSGG